MPELTYDPTPADQPEFNQSEQEALARGEQMEAEESNMLAGKFRSPEDLEQAYMELQKKLGEGTEEEPEQVEETEEVEVSPAAELITNASQMYAETGELTPEVMEQFNGMSSADLVSAYMEMQGQIPSADLTDQQVNNIYGVVGGQENYQRVIEWSKDNLDQTDIEAFDNLVDSGNDRMIALAVSGLNSLMEKNVGFEGEMATGRAPRQQADVFRSQAEVVAAMQDPRYDRDPAYRNDVFEKLGRSNVNY